MTSALSNVSDAGGDSDAYVAAVLQLLKGLEPLEVLNRTAHRLQTISEELTTPQTMLREGPGKWTIAEVLAHLADSELVWGYRIRRILTEERPRLDGYDQDRWAERLGYVDQAAAQSVEVFQALRSQNLRVLGRAGPEDFGRCYVHGQRGEETMERMVELYAGHDLAHLKQIERISATIG